MVSFACSCSWAQSERRPVPASPCPHAALSTQPAPSERRVSARPTGTPQVPHRLPLFPAGFSFPDQDVAPQHLRGEPAPPRSVRGWRGALCGPPGARVDSDPSSLSPDRRGMCASPFSTRRSTTPRAGSCPRSGGTPPRTSGEGPPAGPRVPALPTRCRSPEDTRGGAQVGGTCAAPEPAPLPRPGRLVPKGAFFSAPRHPCCPRPRALRSLLPQPALSPVPERAAPLRPCSPGPTPACASLVQCWP